MSEFRIIEHRSDIGIEVESTTLSGLFEAGVFALYSIVFEQLPPRIKGKENENSIFHFDSSNIADLVIDLLNHLIYLLEVENRILYKVVKVDKNGKTVECILYSFDYENTRLKKIVKAATYHDLLLEKKGQHFKLRIIFDI